MKFTEKIFAAEYDRRMRQEKYPGVLLSSIMDAIPLGQTILDVGAGTGLFSIPLRDAGYRVIALEPSDSMISIMKSNAGGKYDNLTIIHSDWESWDGTPIDVIISIHSMYEISDTRAALRKMKNKSRIAIVIARDPAGQITLTEFMRSSLGLPGRPKISSRDIKNHLDTLLIPFTVKKIIQNREHAFSDIHQEAAYYMNYFSLLNNDLPRIIEQLHRATSFEEGIYRFSSQYHDSMFIF